MSAQAGTAVTIDVLRDWYGVDNQHQGDHDPDGDPLSLALDTEETPHGRAVIVPNGDPNGNHTSDSPYVTDPTGRDQVSYTPDPGFIGEDSFTYTISDGRGGSDTATVTVTVRPPTIRDVAWIAENSPLDANPNPGGGQRIFPDKPTGDPADYTNYRAVEVRARLTTPIAGVRIAFKAFDVDDPSAGSENDPDGIIDDESRTADNASGDWRLSATTATTNASGEAAVELVVSMQPGDNWRVVATTDPALLAGLLAAQNDGPNARVVDGDGQAVPGGNAVAVASNMLTAWRKLKVEVDSMGKVTGNTIKGTITNVQPGTVAGTSVVTISQALFGDEDDRFANGGTLTSGGTAFEVLGNKTGLGVSKVTVNNKGDIKPIKGAQFELADDDLMKEGTDVPMPDTTTLEDALAEAFIKPNIVRDKDDVAFDPNVEGLENRDLVDANWGSRAENRNDNWVTYILGAFQGDIPRDGDPDTERSILLGKTNDQVTGGSLTFFETINDYVKGQDLVTATDKNRDNVVHEVGHALSHLQTESPRPTRFDPRQRGGGPGASRYSLEYLAAIRGNTTKPLGP